MTPLMSSAVLRSTYRRMVKYLLRHWCMEIKCDNSHRTSSPDKNDHTMKTFDDKKTDDDDFTDPQLEWEHEQGIEQSPQMCRKSTEDLLDILLGRIPLQSSPSEQSPLPSNSSSSSSSSDFEWDHLFDFAL